MVSQMANRHFAHSLSRVIPILHITKGARLRASLMRLQMVHFQGLIISAAMETV